MSRYAETLVRVAGAPPRLDFALLGLGPDGHVCSLFPGHAALREGTRFVVAIYDAPKPPARRLTVTLPVLTAARLVVVAAAGNRKGLRSSSRIVRSVNQPTALAAASKVPCSHDDIEAVLLPGPPSTPTRPLTRGEPTPWR